MGTIELLQNQLSRIDAELISLSRVDISDFKAVYSRQRKLEHLKREKYRIEIQIGLEAMEKVGLLIP